jgi:hypothetical protein
MIGNVEKFSKVMFLRQFRQPILWPDLFDQFGQLRRIRISEVTLELLGHGKVSKPSQWPGDSMLRFSENSKHKELRGEGVAGVTGVQELQEDSSDGVMPSQVELSPRKILPTSGVILKFCNSSPRAPSFPPRPRSEQSSLMSASRRGAR